MLPDDKVFIAQSAWLYREIIRQSCSL